MRARQQHAGFDGAAQARLLRDQIISCCMSLRWGQPPQLDTAGMSPENTRAISELSQIVGQIKQHNNSLTMGLEALRDGFAIFGPDLRLIHANRAFRNFFRAALRVEVGVSFFSLAKALEQHRVISPDDTHPGRWAHETLARIGCPRELRLRTGRIVSLDTSHDDEGNLICLVTDITAQSQRQQELELARQRAEDATRAKSTFLAHMSHEFRTPMNGVIGMAELLCDSGLTGEPQRYAETIRGSAEALLTLINDVLDYSRGQARTPELTETSFDLEHLAAEVGTLLMPNARAKGIALRMIYDALSPSDFVGDAGRVRQVLVNLLGNAVKYTQSGFVRLQIIQADGGVVLMVQDSGPGIPDEQIDDIFEEFSRLDAPGTSGMASSGLGLAISHQLVRAMQGRLWVHSEMGQGTCFGVWLPLKPVDVSGRKRVSGGQAMRILLVHQDAGMCRRLRRMFSAWGARLFTVADARDAARMIDGGFQPHFVMLFYESDVEAAIRDRAALAPLTRYARYFLMTEASNLAAETDCFDKIIFMPVSRRDILAAVLDALHTQKTLPAPVAADPAAPCALAGRGATRRTGLRRMKVLLADDNATNRLVVDKMLRRCDVDLIEACDGQQALMLWQSERPDLTLMDISMPVMDGHSATEAIRRIETEQGLVPSHIVAVTANAGEDDRQAMLAAGMDDVIGKPVRRASLLAQLIRFAPKGVHPPIPLEGAPGSAGKPP